MVWIPMWKVRERWLIKITSSHNIQADTGRMGIWFWWEEAGDESQRRTRLGYKDRDGREKKEEGE